MNYVRQPLPPRLSKEFSVLIVANINDDTAVSRSASEICNELAIDGIRVVTSKSLTDFETAVSSSPAYSCVVIGWGICQADHQKALQAIKLLQKRCAGIPIILGVTKQTANHIPLEFSEVIESVIYIPEDSPKFIAGRIKAASKRYLDSVLPPFFGAMVNFDDTHEYSWHTPGHTGGTAFMKTAVGKAFVDFYGEQMLRSDLSISVGELGSLNDHSGPVKESEQYAAKVFGADYTYYSVGGSSASNEIILHSAVTDGDAVLVDRNCHKSLNYALNMSGAMPIYMVPRRNARGVIGPVPSSEMTPTAIQQKIDESPLLADKTVTPVLAALTNSTYDGLTYNVETTTRLLSETVPRIHYDEAWYAYARFNNLYKGRYGMHRGERHEDDATITVTHSTHKLLAALSQASMIHIRSGKVPVKPALFNEAYMMHTSTSPQYSIIASTDVSAKMMDDSGEYLTDECIQEAISFRQAMVKIKYEMQQRNQNDWWFDVWQPDAIEGTPFQDMDPQTLKTDSSAWLLKPNEKWHGFGDLGADYCMLDPIKVTVLTPGMDIEGELEESGIPATLVSSFLASRGIVVEKTEPYSLLLLFSIGATKGKWGSLVAGMMEFKTHYDNNTELSMVLPDLVASHPERYDGLGIRDLAEQMHQAIVETKMLESMDHAFTQLPTVVKSPRETYGQLVKGNIEAVPVKEMTGRIVAVQVVPYPPGIPLMMPGEKAEGDSTAVIDYLLALQAFDSQFPGFEHDTHGVEIEQDDNGELVYMTYCLTE
ncbi:Orn/Lys/Arg decarboxylase N-terminal domain-containing protein [Vibrio aestuarianus]|uniref:Arginine decarboxylase n=1 Tax=Vibrio aestuarianus TaxID=28171 RepID=A0A9X4FAK4_9VIBR|nr:Orn/Lys/Arg decarboxylase N-terminal domain-containing protein [Vibrio aestuarianus]MDE1236886.1 arginine decarboxylase [Vibrio aestuarianus]MDE1247754.1 arginine decarboxylase [Vibrio aestuarianus]MDE1348101.1 arginine decarboxylase [Vibrio aestuarianus]NGZ65016.1 arginine decarboxylase [Vibrio aestuarianus subsp. cardii]